MDKLLTTFPLLEGFNKAEVLLKSLGIPYEVVFPGPVFDLVGVPAVVLTQESRSDFMQHGGDRIINSGWVDYREALIKIPPGKPEIFGDDIFGRASMTVLAPCMADPKKIRTVAYITGNLAEVFPYMNTRMSDASYNPHSHILTFMEGYRMIALYPQRIAVAKADNIVDNWRVLEMVRRRANICWENRGKIKPFFETRKKPPALEIYFRLPKTNCRQCGEKTCMAFALRLWSGEVNPGQCKPIFDGEFVQLKDALMEICQGLGVKGEFGGSHD